MTKSYLLAVAFFFLPPVLLAQSSTVVITAPGTFTNAQPNPNFQVMLNGQTPSQFHNSGEAGYQTDAISGGLITPSGAIVLNVDGIASYVKSLADSRIGGNDRNQANTVAFYGDAQADAAHSAVWGANYRVYDSSSNIAGSNLTGMEIDMGSSTNPNFLQGLAIEIGGTGSAPTGSEYGIYHWTGGTFKPGYGLDIDVGATSSGVGVLLSQAAPGNSQDSQSIAFNATDSAGTGHEASIHADRDGNLILQPSAGSASSFFNNGGLSTPAIEAAGAATLSGTGPCATITTKVGGAWSGAFKCTGPTGAATFTITPGTTANNGWACSSSDITAAVAGAQSASATTSCTIKFSSVTANDVLTFTATAY